MTSYSEIYDIFLSQINDPVFNGLVTQTQDDLMKRYLLNSIPQFKRCKQDLTNRDDTMGTFNIILTDEEELILGTQMVVEYLNPKVTSLDLMSQSFSNKDFQQSSPATLLDKLMKLRETKQKDVKRMILEYTYNNSDLSGLR